MGDPVGAAGLFAPGSLVFCWCCFWHTRVQLKRKGSQGPFLISGYNPDRLSIHLRTNSRHSAEPHPAPAGRRRYLASCGSPDHRQAQDKASLLPDPSSVLFPIKHIQPPASDQVQTIAEKTFKPGLSSPISQCHRELFGWCNKHFLLPVFQKFNPSYRQAL